MSGGKVIVKCLRVFLKTVKWFFIVFVVYLGSLFFRAQKLPVSLVESFVRDRFPTNLVVHVDSFSFGFRQGICVRGLRMFDSTAQNPLDPMLSFDSAVLNPFSRDLEVDRLRFPRLPDRYYKGHAAAKNRRVEFQLPEVSRFSLILNRPEVLGVAPERLMADVESTVSRLSVSRIRLDWPDQDEPMALDGECFLDFRTQEVDGSVKGFAKQHHIRPLLEALAMSVAYPYFDGFTEVPGKVPSSCRWHVNLVNNDFDLYLDLHPDLGKYNGVPMKHADGKIHLHVFIRENGMNYCQTIGPIVAKGTKDEHLEGTVVVGGTNGMNTVTVNAKSALPVADILRIGGFTGEYVGEDVIGESESRLVFRFPRAATNICAVLNGEGHCVIHKGRLMRLKAFKGLLEAMPSVAPAVSWFTDSTQASCDYTIQNGILKTDNIYIEGSVFSIKMFGTFNAVKNELDFTARVQFMKKDSWTAKLLHPLTLPFTKLLLEFKLTGSADKPHWKYISVLDRVVEAVE